MLLETAAAGLQSNFENITFLRNSSRLLLGSLEAGADSR
jgi:hypothetical protein